MKIRLAVLAVLTALVAGCDDGIPFHTQNVVIIEIQRHLRDRTDVYASIASKEYRLDWEKRAVTFQCPCYLGDGLQYFQRGGSVGVVKANEIKVELLPDAAYDVKVRESGRVTSFSFPSIKP